MHECGETGAAGILARGVAGRTLDERPEDEPRPDGERHGEPPWHAEHVRRSQDRIVREVDAVRGDPNRAERAGLEQAAHRREPAARDHGRDGGDDDGGVERDVAAAGCRLADDHQRAENCGDRQRVALEARRASTSDAAHTPPQNSGT